MLTGLSDKLLLRLRYVGSASLIVGYFVILYYSVPVGVCITLTSDIICLPYAIRKRYWDIVVVILLFSFINVTRLATL